jgi:hypothetical protein
MSQLTSKVVAEKGTMADRVIAAMADLNGKRKPPLDLEFGFSFDSAIPALGQPHLFLKQLEQGNKSHSFSLRYLRWGKDVLVLSIGKYLPERRIEHVASSILAMIARGTNWQDQGKAPRTHVEAYGPTREPGNRRDCQRAATGRTNWRMADCRAGSGLGGW